MMEFLITAFGYAVFFGLFGGLFYITRLLSAVFSSVSDMLCMGVKPVINTAGRWISVVNDGLSGGPKPGKDFIAHWFGSPLLIIFMVLITGYTGAYYFQHVTSVGAESFILEVFTDSSLYLWIELTNQIGTAPDISAADLLAAGGNALLMTAFTDLFISQLFPHRSNMLKQPLSYITVVVYGLIFFAFTGVLGDLISAEVFADIPQEWWNAPWITLPALPVINLGRFVGLTGDQLISFQQSLNTAVTLGFCFVMVVCLLLFLSNILSAFSCCAFSFVCLLLFSPVLNWLSSHNIENFELLIAGIAVGSLVVSDVLAQTERVSELIESTRPFVLVTDTADKIESCLEEFFNNLPISTLAILFSGIFGGPCILMALDSVLSFLSDGFPLEKLPAIGFLVAVSLAFSVPCFLSARKRGHDKKVAVGYFVVFVCFVIPLVRMYLLNN